MKRTADRQRVLKVILYPLAVLILLVLVNFYAVDPGDAQAQQALPRVNAPRFNTTIRFGETAVFWFGRVDNDSNYVDVRVGYNNEKLWIRSGAFDRRLWYDAAQNSSPDPADLSNWDAVTIFLDVNNNNGANPSAGDYRYVAQLNQWEPRTNYQAAYRGSGSGWQSMPFGITATSGWRGNAPRDNSNDRGWSMEFEIPFSALGLSGPPPQGTVWGLGVALHDRDSADGPPRADQVWPTAMDGERPSTWGDLVFGLPGYDAPNVPAVETVTVRHGLDGVVVKDAHVGGSTTCGSDYAPNFFNGWGDANYSGARQVNIQNQLDLSDWPCFSKFYLDFPLDAVPSGKSILSAELIMHQFGGANPDQAEPSLIQVHSVTGDWNESTITWNNAPQAQENVAAAWADPIRNFPGWPGVPITWDVSGAVAEAYAAGGPLRLALYESDWAYHSGKYFLSSEEDNWNAVARPTLKITWGQAGPAPTATPDTPSPTATPAATDPTPTATPVPGDCEPVANNAVRNGGFEEGTSIWKKYFSNGAGVLTAAGPAFECDQAARITFSSSSNNMQLYQTGLTLQPNTDYVLSFAAYSTTGHDMKLYVQKHTSPYTSYGINNQSVNLSNSWQTFTIPFRTPGSVSNPRLRFWFVNQAKAGDVYWIDDVRIVPADASATATPSAATATPVVPTATLDTPPPTNTPAATDAAPTATAVPGGCDPAANNAVRNGGFEEGTSIWKKYFANGAGVFAATGPALECDQAARITFSSSSNNMQLYQTGLTLQPNTDYVLSFAAYSTTGHDMKLYIQKHTSPYTSYGVNNQNVNLSSSWQTFTVPFRTPGSVSNPRLRFWFVNQAEAGDVYWIDDVRIVPAGQ